MLIGRCGGGSGASGAWAIVWRNTAQGDAGLVVPDTTATAVPFLHFETTDTTVFQTSPGSVSGDTVLKCAKAGVYTFEMGAQWTTTFAQNAQIFVNVQTFHGPSWAHPANFYPPVAPGSIQALRQMFDARVYPFTDADLSGGAASVEVDVRQVSGSNKTLGEMYLRVAYLPTGGTETVVY